MKISASIKRVEEAKIVVNNCQEEIDKASKAILYFKKGLSNIVDGTESGYVWDQLRYWERRHADWTDQLTDAESTLQNEKYTLAMYRSDRVPPFKRV